MNHSNIFFAIIIFLTFVIGGLEPAFSQRTFTADYAEKQLLWVEKKIDSLSLDEKIGQLFMVAAYSEKDEAHKKSIEELIKKHQIGGLIFFKGEPEEQVRMTNRFQLLSKTPMLIAIDGEWGLSMRLKDTPKFPRQLTLGAIQNNQLIYDMGKEIASECQRMGIHINLAPVVDVNNNPNNPVINDRSFGEDKENVAKKSVSYMEGMEMNGIIACAKHFPGHGDTDKDSHHTLPVINHSADRIHDIELYPFKEMIKHQVGSIMTAHLAIPALDDTPLKQPFTDATPAMPASLSKKIVTNLLREELGYEGLIFTDALNMKGVSSHFAPGEVDLKALLAGNDILLFPEDVGKAIEMIKKAVTEGQITEEHINKTVRKILKTKFRVGLETFKPISTNNLVKDLNTKEVEMLIRDLKANAITVARNDKDALPIVGLDQQRFASIAVGAKAPTAFQKGMSRYTQIDHFGIKKDAERIEFDKMYDKIKYYNTVFVSLHDMSRYSGKNHGITQESIELIYKLRTETNVVLTLFGTPYALDKFPNNQTVVVAYQEDEVTQDLTSQAIFGALSATGRLPVGIPGTVYEYGTGVDLEGNMRLQYGPPEKKGIKMGNLEKIDNVIMSAIKNGATPGAQILVAKDNMVIYNKAYGHHTYGRKQSVLPEDIYDLASITKVAATLPVLMEMYQNENLSINQSLGSLLPELKGTNKANMKVKDVLTHQAQLAGWIPFYARTIETPEAKRKWYSSTKSDKYSVEIAKDMYMNKVYQDSVWARLVRCDNRSKPGYKYSDLGYYIFQRIAEKYGNEGLDEYAMKNYYEPLGMQRAGFNPLKRFDDSQIVPTENDDYYRNQLLRGYVHDMGAAMLDGVCGHAGLFSNSNDLAILMQMFLNGGTYGDRVYFDPETINLFTKKQNNGCRRGLGFDKPEMRTNVKGPTASEVSASTFGHTGFTGTCAWVDPEDDLIFIFLSNRVHPDMNNKKLIKDNVRTEIQSLIYKAISDPYFEQHQ